MNKLNWHIVAPVLLIWLLLIWHPGLTGYIISPLLFILFAAYLSYALLYRPSETAGFGIAAKGRAITNWLVWCLLAIISICWAYNIFSAIPVDVTKSDIIPHLREIYYQRLSDGTYIYSLVDGYGYGIWTPNYLPMHWLPFVPAFFWGVEPRWVPVIIFLITTIIYTYLVDRTDVRQNEKLLKIALPFIFLFSVFYKQRTVMANAVELLIASYYMLAGIGLAYSSVPLKIIGFSSALMSRYIAAFFLPVDAYIAFREKNRKAVWVYGGIFIVILLIYVLPFLTTDPFIFFKGAQAYDVAALGEWQGQSWQKTGDVPFQLFRGYGFASWFYKAGNAPLAEKIGLVKLFLLTMMVATIAFLAWLYHQVRNRKMFRITGLFICLVVFTSFVLVPYNYLYWNVLFLMPVMIMRIKLTRA